MLILSNDSKFAIEVDVEHPDYGMKFKPDGRGNWDVIARANDADLRDAERLAAAQMNIFFPMDEKKPGDLPGSIQPGSETYLPEFTPTKPFTQKTSNWIRRWLCRRR